MDGGGGGMGVGVGGGFFFEVLFDYSFGVSVVYGFVFMMVGGGVVSLGMEVKGEVSVSYDEGGILGKSERRVKRKICCFFIKVL